MTKACSAPSIDDLRAEAHALRLHFASRGITLRHTRALALTAEKYGYPSWQAFVAGTQANQSYAEGDMTKPLGLPSVENLKAEARALREQLAAEGTNLRHTRALARVAEKYGYRTWEALVAAQCDDD